VELNAEKPHVSPAQTAVRDVIYREKAFARELEFGRGSEACSSGSVPMVFIGTDLRFLRFCFCSLACAHKESLTSARHKPPCGT